MTIKYLIVLFVLSLSMLPGPRCIEPPVDKKCKMSDPACVVVCPGLKERRIERNLRLHPRPGRMPAALAGEEKGA